MNWLLVLVITLAAGGIGGTIIFLISKYADERAESARLRAELAEARRVILNEQKSSDAMAEHRDDSTTSKRLSDGSF